MTPPPAEDRPPAPRQRLPNRIERLDIAAIHALRPWIDHPLTKVADTIGKLGDEPPVATVSGLTLVAGLLLRRPRMARAGLRMLAAHGVAVAAKSIGKNRIDRTRPFHMLDTGHYRMEPGRSRESALQSFPSGHAAGAVAAARAAGREFSGARIAFDGVAATIAALQVPRKAHFPTDVIAGAVVGLAAEALTNLVWKAVFKR